MRRASLYGVIVAALTLLLCAGMPGNAQQLSATDIVGGRGGDEFSDFQPPAGARVIEVRIRSGDKIDSVQMMYALADGRSVQGPRHGGSGGGLNTFRLDPDEYIIGLSGRCGDQVDSLRIHSNKRTSALFGGRGGNRDYRIDVPAGYQAVGFAGRAGDLMDAIGLIYTPVPRRRAILSPTQVAPARFAQTQLAGGRGGNPFSDQEAPEGARIAEVRVRGGDQIDAVQLIYLTLDGRLVEGPRHGGSGGNERIFRLDRDEYIIGIAGRCGDNVDSLRIITNKRTSEVFGGRGVSRDYRIDVPAGNQALGFAGRSGEYLDAIGLTYARMTYRR
ncbi:MAG: hypothetical protein LAP85_14020 [Acidobacteriia bacterium]|nr:hypothetical protein [Terriglobia bacterium]